MMAEMALVSQALNATIKADKEVEIVPQGNYEILECHL